MKDIIKRSIISLVFGAFLGYLGYLFLAKTIIVQGEFVTMNTLYYSLLFFVGAFMVVFYGIYPIHIKMNKLVIFCIGILCILMGEYILIDDVARKIFLADIVKVMGVLLTVLSPTGIFVTDKINKKMKESKMEVIEV